MSERDNDVRCQGRKAVCLAPEASIDNCKITQLHKDARSCTRPLPQGMRPNLQDLPQENQNVGTHVDSCPKKHLPYDVMTQKTKPAKKKIQNRGAVETYGKLVDVAEVGTAGPRHDRLVLL